MRLDRIRTKFLIVLIPLFLVSFIMLSSVSYYVANRALMESSVETAKAASDKFSTQIKDIIEEKMIRLDDLSRDDVLISADDSSKVTLMQATLKEVKGFDSLLLTDNKGAGINSKGQHLNRADREYIQQVIKTKKPYVSEALASGTSGNLIVSLAEPILRNGELKGIIVGTVSLEKLSGVLENVKFKESGYGYIVDSTGIVVAHNKRPELINKLNISEKTVNPELKTKNLELDERLITAFKSVSTSGKQTENIFYTSTAGGAESAVLTPIDLDGRRWVMVVTAPEQELTAAINQLAKWMVGLSVIAILIAIIVIFMFSKNIAQKVIMIRDESVALNQGDLRERVIDIHSEDEIGQLSKGFIGMRQTLNQLITTVQTKANQVTESSIQLKESANQSAIASTHVAESITDIAAGADRQFSAVNEVNTIAKEISSSASDISRKASGIVEVVKTTTKHAEQGRFSIAKAVTQMQQVSQGSEAIQTAVMDLEKGSQEIGNIVELISSIAGQTNLLALNAAIEAARAGEAGRGFAVVAEEVRKLAEESNQSSQKIGELVKRNQIGMEQAVNASKTGTESINLGMEAVSSADETFKSIVSAIEQLAQEINTVAEAINHMSAGSATMLNSINAIDQVAKANTSEVQDVSAATEEQSASMEEIAAASQNLANLAMELQEAISTFRV
jgi:methyl-accepting chemotaxis protein